MKAAKFELQNRDLDLLTLVRDWQFVKTSIIAKHIFPGVAKTTVLRRLRKLNQHGYLRRVRSHLDDRGEYVWLLTSKGADYADADDWPRNPNLNHLEHDALVGQVRSALSCSGVAHDWINERRLRQASARRKKVMGWASVVPDGLFAINLESGYQVVALELELSLKAAYRYQSTFKKYEHLKTLDMIWYVVSSVKIGAFVSNLWNKHVLKKSHLCFGWVLVDEILKRPEQLLFKSPRGNFTIHTPIRTLSIDRSLGEHPGGIKM